MLYYKQLKPHKHCLEALPLQTKSLLHLPAVCTLESQIFSTAGGFAFEKILLTEKDIENIIISLLANGNKLSRLNSYIDQQNVPGFCRKHLSSVCFIYQIAEKFVGQRRIGNNLKGFSRSIMLEMEAQVWDFVEREIAIFKKDLKIQELSRTLSELSKTQQN